MQSTVEFVLDESIRDVIATADPSEIRRFIFGICLSEAYNIDE